MLSLDKLRASIQELPNVFWTYFVSYLIVILLPLIVLSYASYNFTVSTLENELSQATIYASKQKNASIEKLISEMQSIAIRIGLDGRITSFLNDSTNPFLLNETRDILKTAASGNEAIQSIDFFAKDANLVIASDGYTRTYTQSKQDIWIKEGEHSTDMGFWLSSRQGNGIDLDKIVTYVVKVPVQRNAYQGLLAVHIHESELSRLLQKMEGNPHTTTYLLDRSGNDISTSASASQKPEHVQDIFAASSNVTESIGYRIMKTEGDRYLITYVNTLHNQWRIVTETPLQYLLSKLSYIRTVAWAAFIVLVVLGLISSYFMSRKMVSPIQLLIKKTQPYNKQGGATGRLATPQKNELEAISHILDQVFSRNETWEQQFHMNLPVLRERFLLALINHKYSSTHEINGKLEFLHLHFPNPHYVIFLIEIDGYDLLVDSYSATDQNLYKYAMMNIAEEIATKNYTAVAAESDEHQLVLLVNIDGNPQQMKQELGLLGEQIKSVIYQLLKISVTLGIGRPYPQVMQAHYSYKEACEVIRSKMMAGTNTVLCYEDLIKETEDAFYLPPHFTNHMYNFLKAGQLSEALDSLEELFQQIKARTKLSEDVIFRTYNLIVEDTTRKLQETNVHTAAIFGLNHNLFRELAAKETIHAIHEWMCTIVRKIHEALQQQQPKKNTYIDTVLAYMNENYHLDLSVEMIAEQVNLNHAYVSRMFKQEVGKTMLEYLTLKRLEVSKVLLNETEQTILEIAINVGYNNVNSFIRFFKRYEGLTPGDYRKTIR
jgi:two-component system response regulator YesN